MQSASARDDSRPLGTALLVVLLASSPCAALMYTALTPILPQLATHLGGNVSGAVTAQLVMAMPGIGLMLGGPLTGWGVERIGARPLLLVAFAAYALAGSAGLYLDSAPALLASRVLLGVAAAGIGTATLTTLGQYMSGARRAQLVGYQMAFGAMTGLVSMLASGRIAELAGWRAPFAFYLLPLAMLALAVWTMPAATRQHVATVAASPLRQLWRLYLLAVPLYAAVFVTSTQAVFVLAANGVTRPGQQAPIIALAALFNAVGAWHYGRVRGWLGLDWTLRLSLLLMASGHLLLAVSQTSVEVGFGCALAGLGAGLVVPHLMNRVLDRAPEATRGRAIGLLYSAQYLGSFLNPMLFAPFTALWGIHAAIAISGALLLLSAAVSAIRRDGRFSLRDPT